MKERYELRDMICEICYVFLQNDKFDDACYTDGMTFQNPNLAGPLTSLIQIWQVHLLYFP